VSSSSTLAKALDQSSRLYERVGATVTNNGSNPSHLLVIDPETRPIALGLARASLL
jgi:hypothetical protein